MSVGKVLAWCAAGASLASLEPVRTIAGTAGILGMGAMSGAVLAALHLPRAIGLAGLKLLGIRVMAGLGISCIVIIIGEERLAATTDDVRWVLGLAGISFIGAAQKEFLTYLMAFVMFWRRLSHGEGER